MKCNNEVVFHCWLHNVRCLLTFDRDSDRRQAPLFIQDSFYGVWSLSVSCPRSALANTRTPASNPRLSLQSTGRVLSSSADL